MTEAEGASETYANDLFSPGRDRTLCASGLLEGCDARRIVR